MQKSTRRGGIEWRDSDGGRLAQIEEHKNPVDSVPSEFLAR